MIKLPKEIRRLPEGRVAAVIDRFQKLVELKPAPNVFGSADARASTYRLAWPKEELIARALPGGIASLDLEEGYDYDQKLDDFLSSAQVREVLFWAIGAEKSGVYCGPFSSEVRWWIKSEIVLSPVAVLSTVRDIVLIADDQWRFSVVGGDSETIATLEHSFGGPEALKENFASWIERCGIGFGEADKAWAYRYPYTWSGWSI